MGLRAESGKIASRTASPHMVSGGGRIARGIASLLFSEAVGIWMMSLVFFYFLQMKKVLKELLELL